LLSNSDSTWRRNDRRIASATWHAKWSDDNAAYLTSALLSFQESMQDANVLIDANAVAAKLLPKAPAAWVEVVELALAQIASDHARKRLEQPTIDATILIDVLLESGDKAHVVEALIAPIFFCQWQLATFKKDQPGFILNLFGFMKFDGEPRSRRNGV
jgi:hypothetical protein